MPAELKILCGLFDVFLKNLDVLLLSHDALHLDQIGPGPVSEKHRRDMTFPPPSFTVGLVIFGLRALLPPKKWNIPAAKRAPFLCHLTIRLMTRSLGACPNAFFPNLSEFTSMSTFLVYVVCAGLFDLKPLCSSCQGCPAGPLQWLLRASQSTFWARKRHILGFFQGVELFVLFNFVYLVLILLLLSISLQYMYIWVA